ncbi:MAG: Deoxycytidine deaminase [Candidatus Moranbacteria bacterium GW2011_GWF2_44_10]|nr:MAG: Deoxycytidine deaminase [Candidatus Moranbacteria bacterium GW2011_GWF2_44_10]
MLIGIKDLLKLVKEKKLVENLSERELKNPEGSGFDLRMGEVYELEGYGYLGLEERETPKSTLVAKFDAKKITSYIFEPGKYYLIKTIETVNPAHDQLPETVQSVMDQFKKITGREYHYATLANQISKWTWARALSISHFMKCWVKDRNIVANGRGGE